MCVISQSKSRNIAKDHTTQHEEMMMVRERAEESPLERPTANKKNIFQQVLNSLTSIWSSPHKFSLSSLYKLVEYSNFFIESLFNIINFFLPYLLSEGSESWARIDDCRNLCVNFNDLHSKNNFYHKMRWNFDLPRCLFNTDRLQMKNERKIKS